MQVNSSILRPLPEDYAKPALLRIESLLKPEPSFTERAVVRLEIIHLIFSSLGDIFRHLVAATRKVAFLAMTLPFYQFMDAPSPSNLLRSAWEHVARAAKVGAFALSSCSGIFYPEFVPATYEKLCLQESAPMLSVIETQYERLKKVARVAWDRLKTTWERVDKVYCLQGVTWIAGLALLFKGSSQSNENHELMNEGLPVPSKRAVFPDHPPYEPKLDLDLLIQISNFMLLVVFILSQKDGFSCCKSSKKEKYLKILDECEIPETPTKSLFEKEERLLSAPRKKKPPQEKTQKIEKENDHTAKKQLHSLSEKLLRKSG